MQWTEQDRQVMWMLLNHFKSSEAWGDPLKMHPSTMFLLDKYRGLLPHGCWIKVHCGYKDGGHSKNSYHYKARAVDFHVVGCSLLEAERHLMRLLNASVMINGKEFKLIEFVGVGIYLDWNDPGFHLDTRGVRASWARIDGAYVAYTIGLEKAKELNL